MKGPLSWTPLSGDTAAVRKLGVGILLAAILFLLPAPEGLSRAGKDTLALFAVVVYFWATETLPLPVTALGAGVGLVLLGIVASPNEAWSPYMQDTIVFLLGSLILADAVTKTNADKVLSARILRGLGGHTDSLLLGILLASSLPAMVISDHAVAAIMLPLVISLLRSTGLYRRHNIAAAYILAIAFGTAVAGLATPSGGGRNVIVIGYLDELYGVQVSYLAWAIRGVPITLAMIPLIFLILKFMFKVPHEEIDRTSLHLDETRFDNRQRLTMMILGVTILLWVTLGEHWGLGTIAIMGAIALFAFRILDWLDTRRRITWGVPLIYGAALSMGAAMQQTGAAQWLAQTLLGLNPWQTPTALLMAAILITFGLTQFMSDGGTTAVVAPITLAMASLASVNLATMGMATAMASAFSFLLVVGTPPNMIAYSSGLFTARELARAGAAVALLALVVTATAVLIYWPLLPS